ncbi:hypothetical protein BOX15_Mlig015385g2 [Macrostomum lignano]|uniref:Uncharacterized protein n=1 Tax=Macrostomum lignano TaxID=282301 RepID=A0A267EP27_9PLAT|nr:hypothetical protein BOX15_Mlig015385g2 [Macrostomum lignano]
MNNDRKQIKANSRGKDKDLYCQMSGFCQRTTIHGLSHMYQSKTSKRKIFWLTVFVLGLVATIVHLTFHAMQFLESPTIITLDHEGSEFEFPDVTICSQTPTTSRFYERGTEKFPNIQNGFTAMDLLLYPVYNQTYDSVHLLPYKEEILLHKRLIQHQYASMPTKHKGFALDELVIKCSFHKSDCRLQFTLLQNPYYLNCYTFQPPERNLKTTRPEDGLLLLLYIGNAQKNNIFPGKNATITSRSRPTSQKRETSNDWFARILLPEYEPAGVKIVFHEKDAFPALRAAGSIVGAGQFSEIELGMIQERKLNKGSSPCVDTEPKVWFLTSLDESGWPVFREFNAEPGDCIYEFQQRDLYKECGCTSHRVPLQRDHKMFNSIDRGDQVGWCYNSTSLLLDLGLDVNQIVKSVKGDPAKLVNISKTAIQSSHANSRLVERYLRRVNCHDSLLDRFSDPHYNSIQQCTDGGEKALYACQKNEYKSVHSTASWPRYSDIQEIIEEDILPALLIPKNNLSDGNKTKVEYRPLAHDLFDFDSNGQWIAQVELVKENFVKLQLHPVEVLVNVHREEPAYSIWEALGELGGIIGLWLGMSFLGVIEVCEFVIDLTSAARRGKTLQLVKRKEPDAVSGPYGEAESAAPELLLSEIPNGVDVDQSTQNC